MGPDDICRKYSESDVQFKVWDEDDTVFIQGTRESLLFLSKLIEAQAKANDDGFQIAPNGPGSRWFAKGSTKGIYFHRVE